MSKQRHIIGRTVLELDTKQLADVWSLQEEVSSLFQQQGMEEIARLFDQLVPDEEVVRLDQLVVDIGSIDRRFLADEFIHKLLDALRETLGDRLLNNATTPPKLGILRESAYSHLKNLIFFSILPLIVHLY